MQLVKKEYKFGTLQLLASFVDISKVIFERTRSVENGAIMPPVKDLISRFYLGRKTGQTTAAVEYFMRHNNVMLVTANKQTRDAIIDMSELSAPVPSLAARRSIDMSDFAGEDKTKVILLARQLKKLEFSDNLYGITLIIDMYSFIDDDEMYEMLKIIEKHIDVFDAIVGIS